MLGEHELHKAMKSSRHAGQAERRADKLVQARGSSESRLTHRLVTHAELMKSTKQIKFGEQLGPTSFGNEVARSRGWKTISDGLGVQHAVVDNHPKLAVFFWREEYWRRVIGTTAPDDACVEKSFDLTIKFRLVMRCHRIRPTRWWF